MRYQALLLENPDVTIFVCGTLTPATLLPNLPEDLPFHSCFEILSVSSNPRPDLSDRPLDNPEVVWFTDGSSVVLEGKGKAGCAVVSLYQTAEAQAPPTNFPAQLAELITLTEHLQ